MAETAPEVAYVPQEAGNALVKKKKRGFKDTAASIQANVAQKAANAAYVPPMMPNPNGQQ
jgi:hypothetical protein